MGPTWGPPGADRTQVGAMLAPWTLLSGSLIIPIDGTGPVSILKPSFRGMGISMLKSRNRLIFNMVIYILVRRYLYIETASLVVVLNINFDGNGQMIEDAPERIKKIPLSHWSRLGSTHTQRNLFLQLGPCKSMRGINITSVYLLEIYLTGSGYQINNNTIFV